jgi:hypothetical protein
MMDHLSLKDCAAAGTAWIPIKAGTVAIAAILENERIIASQTNAKGQCKLVSSCSCHGEISRVGKK